MSEKSDWTELVDNAEEVVDEEVKVETTPAKYTKEWHDHVMSLFITDELQDGKPKCDGLKRVAQLLFGPIRDISITVHGVTIGWAAVTAKVSFGNVGAFDDDGYFAVSGSADASSSNVDAPYNNHPLAVAETRAIGRALKTALGLQVLVAEEGSKAAHIVNTPSNDENRVEGSISDAQVAFINRMADKLKIDPVKSVEVILGHPVQSLDKLTHAEALSINGVLNNWSQTDSQIPESVKLSK